MGLIIASFLQPTIARASVTLFLEEPFGTFGAVNPTGHAALYFDHICAETPTRLRLCNPGETGAVISRYHHVNGMDWVAIPLIPYLYAVDTLDQVPDEATPATERELRDAYRRQHLTALAPDAPGGGIPSGEWIQLVGSSFDRKIYAYEIETTPEQEQWVVNRLNDHRNRSDFNLFFHNCADFSRVLINGMFPHAVRRNFFADFNLTTPKQVARSMQNYSRKRGDLVSNQYMIPQVPGSIPRSHRVRGIAESLVLSKKYALPLVAVTPFTTGTLFAAYFIRGRFSPAHGLPLLPEVDDTEHDTISLDSATISVPGSQTKVQLNSTTCVCMPDQTASATTKEVAINRDAGDPSSVSALIKSTGGGEH